MTKRPENIEFSAAAMVEALNSRIDENNTAGPKTQSDDRGTSQFAIRNCGGGCNKSSDVKPKNSRCENERIERKVEVKTRYFSATVGASTK